MELRRADGRHPVRHGGSLAWHSFSFGEHYDPGDVGHGLLVAHAEELLAPGEGYPLHLHRGSEVVTWVLAGTLAHVDRTGARRLLRPGTVHRLDPGAGVEHSEHAEDGAVRFVQAWLAPREPAVVPTSDHRQVPAGRLTDRLRLVAVGPPTSAGCGRQHGPHVLRLGTPGAELHVGRLSAGTRVTLPPAPWVHLFVARGEVGVDGTPHGLGPGDAARLGPAPLPGGPGPPPGITALADAEVLVWAMHPPPRPR